MNSDNILEIYSLINPAKIEYDGYDFECYMVVDGIRHDMLWHELEDGALEYDILFEEDDLRDVLYEVAPYVVKLEYETKEGISQSKELIRECYGQGSSIFIATPLGPEQIMSKLRELFYLSTDDGDAYLRFYDPLIFTELAKESNEEFIKKFFGSIYAYWCEDQDPATVKRYRSDGKRLYIQDYTLLGEPTYEL